MNKKNLRDAGASRINVKIFSADERKYKTYLVYTCNGKTMQTKALGLPNGENTEILADEGSDIKVISGNGKDTMFMTDDTFEAKIKGLSDHILIKVPAQSAGSNMFIIDSHLGYEGQMVREVILAYGAIRGAGVSFGDSTKKEVAA